MARYRIGIDIGGTFTDFSMLEEETGEFINSKVLSTPADLTEGVMNALDEFFGNGRRPEDASLPFNHGFVDIVQTRFKEGTIVCPRPGATVSYYVPLAYLTADVVLHALGKFVPEEPPSAEELGVKSWTM